MVLLICYTRLVSTNEGQAEVKGRTKSKKELEADAAAARDAALGTAISSESKGYKMMAKLGFKPGESLGAATNSSARTDPITLEFKEDRGGIGLDSEKKRKFREEVQTEVKRVKAEEGDYRQRVASEREERRLEGMFGGAMRVAEKLADEKELEKLDKVKAGPDATGDGSTKGVAERLGEELSGQKRPRKIPTKQINVLWRGLVRQREDKERDRRMRYDLHQSLTRNTNYDDPEEDKHDRQALGKDEVELEDEEDTELAEFNALEPAERLRRLVEYLRQTYNYCFWCKFRYPDETMDGCPGITEEDHD